ncbi:helix-turn-helix domain-containing protein [Streptococcus suis]|uniref:helix-turn-helix domain-containing protein n=1 Tax=Streptococcus suis TaxID=1307 RepID=UPI000CF381EE
MNQLAQQIKKLRTGQNLSQDDLAEKLYISRQAVSKWENGEATPDIDKLVQLAEIFGVSLDYLVLGKEPEKEIVVENDDWEPWKVSNSWEFLARFWWIPILAFLSWFLPTILPRIFG